MSQLLAPEKLKGEVWWRSLLRRCHWAIQAFRAPANQPMMVLSNGLMLDLQRGVVVINGDVALHATGSLRISADKHLILESGQTPDPNDPSRLHSVWLNPVYDENGQPVEAEDDILIEDFSDETNEPTK